MLKNCQKTSKFFKKLFFFFLNVNKCKKNFKKIKNVKNVKNIKMSIQNNIKQPTTTQEQYCVQGSNNTRNNSSLKLKKLCNATNDTQAFLSSHGHTVVLV